MGWFKKQKKKLKKTFVFKAAKSVTRGAAKVVKVAAPLAGALIGGPIGAGIGTAVGAVAGQVGPNKNRAAQLKRSLLYGGAVTGGTAALGLVSGAGAGASLLQSAGSLFGGGAPAKSSLDDAFISQQKSAGGSGGLDSALLGGTSPGKGGSDNVALQAALAAASIFGTGGGQPTSGQTATEQMNGDQESQRLAQLALQQAEAQLAAQQQAAANSGAQEPPGFSWGLAAGAVVLFLLLN